MRKSFFAAACVVALAVPLIALAAFSRPSSALSSMIYDGKPREFDGKFYVSVPIEGDTVSFSGMVRGMSEGLTPKDMKMSLHTDIAATMSEGDIKGAVDMMVYRKKLYVRLSDVVMKLRSGSAIEDAGFLSTIGIFQNRWFILDLPAEVSDTSWTDMLEEEFDLTPEQAQQMFATVVDALFSMEHTRTKSGNIYLLTLNPEAWAEALTSSINGLDEVNPDLADTLSSEEMFPVLATTTDAYAHALTVRLKMDTTSEGDFRFARFYSTFTLPDDFGEPVVFSIEATAQHRTQPVYLDLPKKTEPLESIFGDFFPFSETPSEEYTPIEDDWWIPTEEPETTPSVERPIKLPPPAPSCSPKGKVRGADISTQAPCPGGRESRRLIRARNVGEFNY